MSPVYASFNPDRFAALPSMQAAYPMLAAIFAWKRSRILAAVLGVWTAAVWFSIVHLGEHYLIDALCAVPYVLVAVAAVHLAARWRGRAHEHGRGIGT